MRKGNLFPDLSARVWVRLTGVGALLFGVRKMNPLEADGVEDLTSGLFGVPKKGLEGVPNTPPRKLLEVGVCNSQLLGIF